MSSLWHTKRSSNTDTCTLMKTGLLGGTSAGYDGLLSHFLSFTFRAKLHHRWHTVKGRLWSNSMTKSPLGEHSRFIYCPEHTHTPTERSSGDAQSGLQKGDTAWRSLCVSASFCLSLLSFTMVLSCASSAHLRHAWLCWLSQREERGAWTRGVASRVTKGQGKKNHSAWWGD